MSSPLTRMAQAESRVKRAGFRRDWRGFRFALALMSVLGATQVAALDAIPDLAGRWSGPGLDLFIDTTRHQANANPARPFERQSFYIRNVTGPMVVFAIGQDLFVAHMVNANTMTVTRGGQLESYTLTRMPR
jgi:hypothetical protein